MEANQNLVFADFTGIPTKLINTLKRELKATGATYRVIKKRLLKVALHEAGVAFDPTQFDAQVGAVFVPGELSDGVAAAVHKFSKELVKEKKEFKMLGAYDLSGKVFLSAEAFTIIAKLPSREVLLGMVLGAMTGPLRAFMYVLQERGKKMVESKN